METETIVRKAALGSIVAVLALDSGLAVPTQPERITLTETTEVRLAQFEVSASGPRELLFRLRSEDFALKVNGVRMSSFNLDLNCPAPEGQAAVSSPPGEGGQAVHPRPASFLFYFDMPHLTMGGRQQALDTAKELVGRLVRDGNRAMIISNAATVTTVAPFRDDPAALAAALERLESDRSQFDAYPSFEPERMDQVVTRLKKDGPDSAMGVARGFYIEDRWRGERNLKRLSIALGLLADADAPKAVVYFADTMRASPGRIYINFFNHRVLDDFFTPASDDGVSPLQIVVREAAAHGIRFYTVQAEGLTAVLPHAAVSGPYASSATSTRFIPTMGTDEAQTSLGSLATETGGQAFLNGVQPARIAESIRSELACIFLVSFDPTSFPEDEQMSLKLTTKTEGIRLHYRGTLVVQSATARRTSKLLAAFLSPESKGRDAAIRTGLVPLGYSGKAFTALVQMAVGRSDDSGPVWDLAISAFSRERTTGEGTGRLIVSGARIPVVLEKEMRFAPGPFELVSVAQDVEYGQIASRRDDGEWPDPDAADAVVGPIVIMQPVAAAFSRDGQASSSGLLALAPAEAARADRATAIVSLICRRRGLKPGLRVERKLVGDSDAPFLPMQVEPSDDRCFQVRDLLPPGTMSAGEFRYEVRVLKGKTELAHGERVFVCSGAEIAPANPLAK